MYFFFFLIRLNARQRGMSLSVDWDNVVGAVDSQFDVNKEGTIDHIFAKEEREECNFVTGSSYTGQWDVLGMSGFGTYTFPHSK